MKQLLSIRPAMEAFADDQRSLVLLSLEEALSMLWLAALATALVLVRL